MTEVNDIHIHGIDQHFVVRISRPLRDREERILTDEVLEPVVIVVMDLTVVKWVGVWEQGAT